MTAAELLVRLLDQDGVAYVAGADFDGALGEALRAWQAAGFLAREPGADPVPGCPRCGEGVPYRLGERYVCNRCHTTVDPAHLRAWELDREAFLGHLAGGMGLRGGVRRLDDRLWQLGTWTGDGGPCECFYARGRPASDSALARLEAYRDVLVLHGLSRPDTPVRSGGRSASLLAVLAPDGSPAADPGRLLRARGDVRFDAHSGAVWVGDARLGEVPVGSKEYHFLACLARHLDHFVPYADLKREVLRQAGSRDGTEEATFCQGLKSRIKKKWVPQVDRLVVTTNKGDGYRLRGCAVL